MVENLCFNKEVALCKKRGGERNVALRHFFINGAIGISRDLVLRRFRHDGAAKFSIPASASFQFIGLDVQFQ